MMNSTPVDSPRRKYTPPVLTRRTPRPTAGVPPLLPPFIAGRKAAARQTEAALTAPPVGERQLAGLLPSAGPAETVPAELTIMDPEVEGESLDNAVAEPTGFEYVAYEAAAAEVLTEDEAQTPEALTEELALDTSDASAVEFGFETPAASPAEPVDEAAEPTEESATAVWAQAEPGWTAPDEDGSAPPAAVSGLEEAVAHEVQWEPESLEEVWDPTDLAEPTAAADDAAEWPDAPAEEPSADGAWWLSVPREAAAQSEAAVGPARHDEPDLQHVADRVAERLEELAQDVRRRGLAALGAGMPEDERLRLDEFSKLIAAVAAGFYGRDE